MASTGNLAQLKIRWLAGGGFGCPHVQFTAVIPSTRGKLALKSLFDFDDSSLRQLKLNK